MKLVPDYYSQWYVDNMMRAAALREGGCEKLPEGPMRDNCEKAKKDGPPNGKGKSKGKSKGKEKMPKELLEKFKAKKAVDLPSEERGGKPGHDEDFKAGFKAGQAAYAKNDQISAADGDKAYKRVSKKHGSWWKDGYSAAIDLARGAYATKGAQIAKKLKLARATKLDQFREGDTVYSGIHGEGKVTAVYEERGVKTLEIEWKNGDISHPQAGSAMAERDLYKRAAERKPDSALEKCREQYVKADGEFKEPAFDNCIEFQLKCKKIKPEDPAKYPTPEDAAKALCAYIGRAHGKLAANEDCKTAAARMFREIRGMGFDARTAADAALVAIKGCGK